MSTWRTERWAVISIDVTSPTGPRAYDENVPSLSDSLSALPSSVARGIAFFSILLGGLAGGLIGYALVSVECEGSCGLPLGIGIMVGAIVAAGGTSIVAVLVLRALGEWRELADDR